MSLTPVQVLDAARAAIPLLPSTSELRASSWEPGDPLPDAGAPAAVATLSSESSLQVLLAASQLIAEALEGAEGMTPAQALMPALEAAAATLGTGVLEDTSEADATQLLGSGDWITATLEADGAVEGWLAVRENKGAPADADAEPAQEAPAAPAGPITQATATPEQRAESMKLLYDVEMTLTAEIGRTKLAVHDVLDLSPGSVIELDRSAGSAADVMVNGRLIARGEIVVVDEEYGIRITEIVSLADQQNQ
ncbi:MAG: flagellar motor switch protein FliN [Mobiluncus porci]|uniref:Flagellar motor switch protein FliN n=1 Tax=Mobiluncus porci TaxID=2652278 RepID=A0A7K0K3F5_9ACTO|nr:MULTISPECIES: flagellar motor switch protein FliN [Mobiluncus]MCI6584713.1 flagellar motor switch protein FliN [Mobiluncus sp.]MDD7540980.1 flagellar motor switch protein FliN [Mobiluncus porci]MDY5748155.1 flagellar motor switch protein FliN [Mobiluncus porci]MST50011.1 flagellar motor switch protein FliN [Mobiluncus porci]